MAISRHSVSPEAPTRAVRALFAERLEGGGTARHARATRPRLHQPLLLYRPCHLAAPSGAASMRPSLQTQLACDCGPTSFVECVPELSGSSPRYNTIEERVLWTPNGA